MTEALWLESKSAQLHQLVLVSGADSRVLVEQLGSLNALSDPWRGQFVCVDRTDPKTPFLSTIKPNGTRKKIYSLASDLYWRPETFSADGKRLLLSGHDESERLVGLTVLSVEALNAVDLIGEVRLGTNQSLHAPQFFEDQIGGFIDEPSGDEKQYYEWNYSDANQTEFVQRAYPAVELVSEFGWSRSKNGQFLNVVQNVLSGRRQQFATLISGRDEVESSGDMVSAFDAVCFESHTGRVFFADDANVVSYDLKSQERLNAVELNGLIVTGLSRHSERSVLVHATDGSEKRLGVWHLNDTQINWLQKLKSDPIAWGVAEFDLPHSDTQTYAPQELGLEGDDKTVNGSLDGLTQASLATPSDTVAFPGPAITVEERTEVHAEGDGDTVGDVPIQPRQSTQLLSSIEEDIDETSTSVPNSRAGGEKDTNVHGKPSTSTSVELDSTLAESEKAFESSKSENDEQALPETQVQKLVKGAEMSADASTDVETESKANERQDSESSRSAARATADRPSVSTPQSDFTAWISQAEDDDDPETILRQLKPYRSDQDVLRQCVEHLKKSLERLSENEDLVLETIVAIAAAAELRAQGTRPLLEQMCAAARARLLEHATLPFVEEHFSLAALRALDHPEGRFSLVVVYEEYEQIIQSVNRDDVSDAKKSKILKRTSTRYRKALEHVLFDSGKKTEVRKQSKPSDTSPSTETPLDAKETRPPEPVQPVAPEAIAPQTYRFKPLAQRFPSQAKPLQTRGASVQDRASSDILRLEDFGPSGDESFHAEETLKRVPKWVKSVLFIMSGIGGLLALVVVLLGFEYSSMLVGGGLCLGLSSLTLLGNEHKHWLASLILNAMGCVILFVTPTSVTLPEAVGPWAFWAPGVVFLSFIFLLWHGQIRENFKTSTYFDDDFD